MTRILLGTLHPYYSRAGGLQFCSTSHFYLILKLILMITLYFQCENHQKLHFSKFSGCHIFWHFCDVNSSTEMRPWELQRLVSVCSQASSWSSIIRNGFILIIKCFTVKNIDFLKFHYFFTLWQKKIRSKLACRVHRRSREYFSHTQRQNLCRRMHSNRKLTDSYSRYWTGLTLTS